MMMFRVLTMILLRRCKATFICTTMVANEAAAYSSGRTGLSPKIKSNLREMIIIAILCAREMKMTVFKHKQP